MDEEVHELGSWDRTIADIIRRLSAQDDPSLTLVNDPLTLMWVFHTEGHCWKVSHQILLQSNYGEILHRQFLKSPEGRSLVTRDLLEKALNLRDQRLIAPTLWDHLDEA